MLNLAKPSLCFEVLMSKFPRAPLVATATGTPSAFRCRTSLSAPGSITQSTSNLKRELEFRQLQKIGSRCREALSNIAFKIVKDVTNLSEELVRLGEHARDLIGEAVVRDHLPRVLRPSHPLKRPEIFVVYE